MRCTISAMGKSERFAVAPKAQSKRLLMLSEKFFKNFGNRHIRQAFQNGYKVRGDTLHHREGQAAAAACPSCYLKEVTMAIINLRACLKSSNEDGNEGKNENLSRNKEFALTIFPKSAEFVEPAEKTLYHPAARQHNKLV